MWSDADVMKTCCFKKGWNQNGQNMVHGLCVSVLNIICKRIIETRNMEGFFAVKLLKVFDIEFQFCRDKLCFPVLAGKLFHG